MPLKSRLSRRKGLKRAKDRGLKSCVAPVLYIESGGLPIECPESPTALHPRSAVVGFESHPLRHSPLVFKGYRVILDSSLQKSLRQRFFPSAWESRCHSRLALCQHGLMRSQAHPRLLADGRSGTNITPRKDSRVVPFIHASHRDTCVRIVPWIH